ncbi:PAS domain-containing sensor histidine kinase [Acidocella sp.]|jgi:PAS domain S-box-containing protein|uniref:PAS domain-containing sensor histidine kinase n=1 Tax=Acidocella sp. TaxID=50710 RepID=UPI002F3EEEED
MSQSLAASSHIGRMPDGEGPAAIFAILDRAPLGAVIVNDSLAIIYGNRPFAAMTAMTAAWPSFDSFLTAPAERRHVHEALATSRRIAAHETSLTAQDGHLAWVLMSTEPIQLAGAPATLVWLDDITARRQASEALRASEERLELAVAGTRSAIWEVDFSRGTTWWSQEFFRMLGYPDDQPPAPDDNVWERHMHPEDAARVMRGIRQYLQLRRTHRAESPAPDAASDNVYEATYRLCRLDGSVIWVVAKGRRSTDVPGRRGRFNGILFDVTAQKRAEQALRQAQQDLIQAEKMAALGSLVAGVAHEINTPLGNTLTASSHLADKVAEFAERLEQNNLRRSDLVGFVALLTETTRLMVANCERAAELVQSFKQVAVDQTSGERRQFDLKHYIDEILLSLRPRLRKTAHRITVSCPENLEIDGYPGALSQLLTNFLLNSVLHAYSEGNAGHITIDVQRTEARMIELVYADDGKGIPPSLLPRIYDPFFTTRRGSGGSGLGLHIVYNLVTTTLRGQISVRSEPGQGTAFIVRFPIDTPRDTTRMDSTDD